MNSSALDALYNMFSESMLIGQKE